jgi:hypothetical protein
MNAAPQLVVGARIAFLADRISVRDKHDRDAVRPQHPARYFPEQLRVSKVLEYVTAVQRIEPCDREVV